MVSPVRLPWLASLPIVACGGGEACTRVAGDGEVAWALRCGGVTNEEVAGVAVDAMGDVYVGFNVRVFDAAEPFRIEAFTVEPRDTDIALAKFDGEGEAVWVRYFPGSEDQHLWLLRACAGGLVIFGDTQTNPVDLGGGPVGGGHFLAALDGDGEHRWSRSVPALDEYAHLSVSDLVCDANGGVVLVGDHSGVVDLGDGPLPESGAGGVVARYDGEGSLLWSRSLGSGAYGDSAAFTPEGDVVIVGFFAGTIDLGDGPMTAYEEDALVTRWSADGATVWSRQFGPGGRQYGSAVAIDATGGITLAGVFSERLTIGKDAHVNAVPSPSPDLHGSGYDGFVAFLDASGMPRSSQHFGGLDDDFVFQAQYRAGDALMLSARTLDAVTLREYVAGEPGWEWRMPETQVPEADMLGSDIFGALMAVTADGVVVAASPRGSIDFGEGPLEARGMKDLLLVKIRR